jgi:hypothetical protein
VRHATAVNLLATGLVALLAVLGCDRGPKELEYRQLHPAERLYVERFLVLERARAVALADPARGVALLDSLAVAWGDTAEAQARAALPSDPRRAALVQDLVRRLLEAEADSLLLAPHPRRLQAPLPTPAPRREPGES